MHVAGASMQVATSQSRVNGTHSKATVSTENATRCHKLPDRAHILVVRTPREVSCTELIAWNLPVSGLILGILRLSFRIHKLEVDVWYRNDTPSCATLSVPEQQVHSKLHEIQLPLKKCSSCDIGVFAQGEFMLPPTFPC